ncbi:ABC transporter transmembrane domain-containing protein, partial [Tritonibacter sp. SIMBA_163]|uniref:ABC transporter transmembrane domain-containing protein n=1 Tax=Tritonibacter sp. SIMBA_163 TaxID=3080868 RepID=UPI00397EC299
DLVFVDGSSDALMWVSIAVFGIVRLRGISSVTQKVILATINERSEAHMRADMLDRLIYQDASFHKHHPAGFLIQRVQS